MRLYSGSSKQFVDDTIRNQIAGKPEEHRERTEYDVENPCGNA